MRIFKHLKRAYRCGFSSSMAFDPGCPYILLTPSWIAWQYGYEKAAANQREIIIKWLNGRKI